MKTQSVFNSLKPYLILMRIFGLIPVDFNHKIPLVNSKLSISFKIHFVLIQCIPVGLNYLMITSFTNETFDKLIVSAILWRVIAILTCVTVNVQSIIQVLSCRKFVKLIKIIDEFDYKAAKIILMNYAADRKKIFVCVLSIIFIAPGYSAISLTFIFLQFQLRTILEEIPDIIIINLCVQYGFLISCVLVMQFIIFVKITKTRFDALNKQIIYHKNHKIKISVYKINELHSLLCDSITQINRCITMNLLFSIIISIINVIFCIFTALTFLFEPDLLEFKSISAHVISNLLWIICNACLIVAICSNGNSLTNSAEMSQEIVLKIIDKTKDEFYCNELRCLLFHMKNRNKKVENIFVVFDWKLMSLVS